MALRLSPTSEGGGLRFGGRRGLGGDVTDLGLDAEAGQELGFDGAFGVVRGPHGASKVILGDFKGDLELAFGGFEVEAEASGTGLGEHLGDLGFVEGDFADAVTAVEART